MKLRPLCAIGLLTVVVGCGDTTQAIHNAADAATGKQALERSAVIRDQIKGLQNAHENQLRQALPPR